MPLAANVCNQMLREVERNEFWSMAHVVMNPGAFSLLHEHKKMSEIYIITKGCGELVIGNIHAQSSYYVQAGHVVLIPTEVPHQLLNTGVTCLEHLVLADPPFDPVDILPHGHSNFAPTESKRLLLPPVQECCDGAKIIPYDFGDIEQSFAFGWVINDIDRIKSPHYHKRSTEWIYVVEGSGAIKGDHEGMPICAGDWIRIDPGTFHSLENWKGQYMVALCMCSPKFDPADVYYQF